MLKILDEETLIAMTRQAVDKALEECSNILLADSKERVPVAEGTLKASGHDEPAYELQSGDFRAWWVWYDTSKETGKPFNYAVIRHEVPPKEGADHTKFLENPYKEKLELFKSYIESKAIEGLTSVKFHSEFIISPKK